MAQALHIEAASGGPEIADLSDASVRRELSPVAIKAAYRIAEAWDLSAAEISQLTGLNERTWYRLKDKTAKTLSQDTLTRVSALVGIYKGLQLLFSEPLASSWPTRPNSNALFAGETPIRAMIRGGIPAMMRARTYIDALRGGL